MTKTPEYLLRNEIEKREDEPKGVKILVDDRINDGKHNDSFWYDGLVMEFEINGTKHSVFAEGDIRIRNEEGELVHDGSKERNGGFPFKLKEDKDLAKLEPNGFVWGMNNWFVVVFDEMSRGQLIINDETILHDLTELDSIIKDLKKEK